MSTSTVPSQLTDAELRLLQALVYQECGMHFDERRAHFLQDQLQRRLNECQLDSFYSYYRLLISDAGKAELAQLLENLTVNETSFFRNRAQLDLFHKYILEDLLRRKQERRDFSLRFWSAGCSTGQEAYTMAMQVAEAQLRDFLPERDDVLRRSRAKTADPQVLPLSESGRVPVCGARGKPAGHDRRVSDGAPQQRHSLPANRGEAVSQSDDRMVELR